MESNRKHATATTSYPNVHSTNNNIYLIQFWLTAELIGKLWQIMHQRNRESWFLIPKRGHLCLFQGKSSKVSAHYTKFVKEDYPLIRILKGLDAKKARADRNEGSEDSDESSGSDDDSDNDSDNELLPELPVFKGEDLIEEEEAMKAKQIEENEVNQQHDETIEDAQQDAQVDAQEDIPMPEAESELVPGSEVVPRSEADEDEEEDSDIESIPMPKGPPPRKPFERQIPQEHQQQRLSRPPPPPPPGGPGRHYRPPPPNAYRPGPGGYRPPPPPPSKSMLNWYHNPFLFACEMFMLFFFCKSARTTSHAVSATWSHSTLCGCSNAPALHGSGARNTFPRI